MRFANPLPALSIVTRTRDYPTVFANGAIENGSFFLLSQSVVRALLRGIRGEHDRAKRVCLRIPSMIDGVDRTRLNNIMFVTITATATTASSSTHYYNIQRVTVRSKHNISRLSARNATIYYNVVRILGVVRHASFLLWLLLLLLL